MSDDVATEPINEVPPQKKKSGKRTLIEWVLVVIIALLVSLFLRTYVFQTYYVPSKSMKPTFYEGNRIVVNKLSVRFGTINTGDIIVFKAPAKAHTACDDYDVDYVKRVIGVPGDQLTSKGNTIYINGTPLKEAWSHYEPIGNAIGHVTVPKNDYFVMGDNHADSCDSRLWGFVPKGNIIGKVFLKYWPLSEWHWF
jgi:signal peptidase I